MKFLVPITLVSLTTAQRDNSIPSPELAMKIWNITENSEQIWDGSNWQNLALSGVTATLFKSSFSGFAQGGLIPSSKIALQIFDVETTFPVNCPGSSFYADNTSTDAVNIEIYKTIGTNTPVLIGTLVFSTGAPTGALSFTSEIVFNVGDRISLVSPSQSFSLGNIFFNLLGSSLIPTY